MRMWRNWQTRRFQVPVGNRMGSSPFIRTNLIGLKVFSFQPDFILQQRKTYDIITIQDNSNLLLIGATIL